MKRILAIDYGERRIGLAVSDMLGITAQPAGFLTVRGRIDAIEKLKEVINEYNPGLIVFGLPRNMDGTEGERVEVVREFAQLLWDETKIEIDFFDERLTTVYADKTLTLMNVSGKKKTGKKDSLSATIILQDYMESHRQL